MAGLRRCLLHFLAYYIFYTVEIPMVPSLQLLQNQSDGSLVGLSHVLR